MPARQADPCDGVLREGSWPGALQESVATSSSWGSCWGYWLRSPTSPSWRRSSWSTSAGSKTEVPKHLPADAERFSGGAGALLDPGALGRLSPDIARGLREGLATAMHSVFLVRLVITGIALVASIFIKELPLRDTAYADEVIGEQVEPNLSAVEGAHDRRDERKDREHRP